ncbi:glycosyltransferase family 2 protein [Paracoccus saliphilus]|uniref:Glycosyltransferase family 2 protein n=1 Tax=Paracoccus saliphilus TaxID=405559 RepID=A0AA46A7V8_9RHOB|nr:glycosyltransferase family 2 protein [Paracoccus saliphilus]WCR05501.1 glycosyltransferase family 2 protein [Paracoccus saliphilus]SIT18864.1 Glycosyltransferase involved in cell wall bisynthesis [Paracoccus saliphilus]
MKISAIITCYNVEEYIATAIQSVIDCNFDDCEIIIVDDCSTDKTREIIDTINSNNLDKNIVSINFPKNTPGGVAAAANAGMDVATGEITLFVDGDDWVVPGPTRRAVEILRRGNNDFVVCNCGEYWNHNGVYTNYPEDSYWTSLGDDLPLEDKRDILIKMAPFPWRKIYSTDFLNRNKIRFPVGDFFFEDNPFHWETTVKSESFTFYNEITHIHRMNRPGQTVGQQGIKFIKIFDHARIIKDKLDQDGLTDRHLHSYVGWLLKHIIWCGNYVPPGFLNEVYEKSKIFLKDLPPDIFWHGVATSGFSATDVRKVAAIYLDQRFEFLREF